MTYKFTIQGRLACLNDYLSAERVKLGTRSGRYQTKGNVLKHQTQEYIIAFIRKDLRGLHINKPIKIHYDFYEPNKKRDQDNVISFIMKTVQDSLVLAKVIDNDGWANIVGGSYEAFVDPKNPRIEVYLIEQEGDNNDR